MNKHYPIFIGGEFRECGSRRDVINPATGEAMASVSVAGAQEVDSAIEAARDAFDSGEWGKLTLKERAGFIEKISQGILDKAAELAGLETRNNGKPIKESTFMDVPSSANTFKYFAENLERFLAEDTIDVPQAQAKLSRQPVGVVTLIVPWNYPLLIASWKMAQALAAGNTVVLKPSSLTPLTALELAGIIKEAGLPKGAVNVVNADGSSLGQALCSDKRIDMISFTGSNQVGKQIIESSSKNVKKLIMELGGKSASIVLKDADIDTAVNGCLCSIFLNQGQMCTAMSRILVEDDIYEGFLGSFVDKAKRIKLGSGLDYQTQMGPLISREQQAKVNVFVQEAIKQGAKALCGARIPVEPELKNGFFFEPTVLSGVLPGMKVFQEEVFGPVACVNKFSTLDEAVSLANASDFGLASSVWTNNPGLADKLSAKINAGIIWVNTYGMFYNELPYGGFKQSGFGKELGREGFLEYTRIKNIISDKSEGAKPLVSYWFGF